MHLEKVSNLVGGEYLAKPVIYGLNQVLIYEGTILRKEYIERLINLGIDEVYIIDDLSIQDESEIINDEVKKDCTIKVKKLLDSHIYKDNDKLSEIKETTTRIINEILEKKEVVEKIYDIRERSADLCDHCINVSTLSILTAVKMNLPENLIYDIGVGSILHDLGLKYISVPYNNISLDELTPERAFEYKKHTVYGFSSVEKESWMTSTAKKILLFHHERINGSGFPLKLRTIAIENRIVAVCDAFDELICGIGCKQVKVQEAIEYIRVNKETKFDSKVVDIFLDFVATYPIGTHVLTNEGDTAIVIEQNEHFSDRPKIRLIKNKDNQIYNDNKTIDLLEVHHVFIEKVLD
ncbi:MAG: transcriptional regulator [Clostridia bacterium]|nr:transcriptional regulator [Clostridia bacterium]